MAVVRTVLPRKGFVDPQHGLTGYEQDFDGNMSLLDTNVAFMSDLIESVNAAPNAVFAGPAGAPAALPSMRTLVAADLPMAQILAQALFAALNINGMVSGFGVGYGSSLYVNISAGVLYAQGILYHQTVGIADFGPAPASATSYLFYNANNSPANPVGFYYYNLPYGQHIGDALIAQVVTSGSAVTAVTAATPVFGQISVAPGSGGNFTVQHFLGRAPVGAIIRQTSSANIYWQTPTDVDATNLYLTASASGTAKILVF